MSAFMSKMGRSKSKTKGLNLGFRPTFTVLGLKPGFSCSD